MKKPATPQTTVITELITKSQLYEKSVKMISSLGLNHSYRQPASPAEPSNVFVMAICKAPDIMLPIAWQD
jgi:hypothetical protein